MLENDDEHMVLQFGNIVLDRRARLVYVDGQRVHLTGSEYRFFELLAINPGVAFTSREILSGIWGNTWLADTSALQVHVSRVRRKLGESGDTPRLIQTLHGYGYRLNPHAVYIPNAAQSDGEEASGSLVQSANAYLLLGRDRVIQWVSPSLPGLLGYREEDVVGKRLYDLLHPDGISEARAVQYELDQGQPANLVLRALTSNSQMMLLQASVQPVLGEDGRAVGFFAQWQPLHTLDGRDDGGSSEELRTVELHFAADFTLHDIKPRQTFAGGELEDISETLFSLLGVEETALRGTLADALADALERRTELVDAVLHTEDANGATRLLPITTKILTDDDGRFGGLVATVRLP